MRLALILWLMIPLGMGSSTAVAHPDCASDDRVNALELRIAELEQKVGSQQAPDADAEKAAAAIYERLGRSIRDGNIDGAREALAELTAKYSNTTAYRRARKIERELEVIGKDAPLNLVVEKWYRGEFRGEQTDFNSYKPTLLIFWEVWCPHCRREVPKIQQTWDKYGTDMNIVGLTKITRSATEEKVEEFLNENGVYYPIAKENGDLSKHFNVSGIPAAAVVKGGKIVWRGHPGRLTDTMIEGWL